MLLKDLAEWVMPKAYLTQAFDVFLLSTLLVVERRQVVLRVEIGKLIFLYCTRLRPSL